MTLRNVVPVALSALTLCSVGSAFAQAPFTIRRPPDGATVREQVRIEIPRASIKPGGFVAFYIDDKFHSATAPQDAAASGGAGKPFAFVWDTKEGSVTDGEHTIRAVLFEPAGGDRGNAVAVEEKESSEVKLTVANKIKNGPKSLTLRYKYRNGAVMEYARNAKSMVVGGLSSNGISTSDQTLNEMKSRILLGIEDSRPAEDVALVRNKLTSLSVLDEGTETSIPESQLSGSMYQELNSQGRVLYETGTGLGLADFSERGLSVNNTLELPLMPLMQVSTGQTWRLAGQRLDIPGLSTSDQPKVTLTSKFEGLEWESGYPTAKIRQTYEGDYGKSLTFNGVEVTTPKVNYERDIYIAYKSGTLVKIKRTLTVSGRTSSELGAPPEVGGGGGSSFGNRMSGGGPTGGPMAAGGLAGASGGSRGPYGGGGPPAGAGGYGAMMGGPGGRAGSGGPYGGMMGGPGGRGGSGGRMGSGGPYGGGQGGPPGGGYGGPPAGGSGGPYGGMIGGSRRGGGKMGGMAGEGGPPGFSGSSPIGRMGGGMTGPPRSGGIGGAGTQETDHPITLRSITETQILPDSNKAQ